MISRIFRIARAARCGFLTIALVMMAASNLARAGLSEAERITLDEPACAQMKSFSRDITLINDEVQNMRRFRERRRLCEVLGRATTTIGSTIGYMQSHIGECTITVASIDQMATLGRQLENDRRKVCR